MRRSLVLCLAVALAACSSEGPQGSDTEQVSDPTPESVDPVAASKSLAHFAAFAREYGLAGEGNELRPRRSRVDELGVTHVRLDQFYKGVRVFEGDAIAHLDAAGNVTETNALRGFIELDAVPAISELDAIRKIQQLQLGEWTIEHSELVVLPRHRAGLDKLAWHVRTVAENDSLGMTRWDYFLDARTGNVAWAFDSLETAAATGTGKTMFTGDQAITTNFASGTYALLDPTRGGGNYTCDKNGKTNAPQCAQITRTNNVFGNNQKNLSDRATAGADAHYGLQATWDYYATMFGRNGIDGAGRKTYSRVHYGTNYQNAFWSNSCFCMTYGDGGTTFFPLVSVDIAGHEMSHGVMSTEAKLTYSGESGGLNESNSDIFGTLVEYQVNSALDVPDYWVGERIYKANWSADGTTYTQVKALRYMDDPFKDTKSPACWSSSLGSLDVHYSSGPNNHMFYLLAEGGTSKCNGNVVSGIGRDAAARIWYKAVTDYMTSSTNYAGARTAALTAASALYGAGSPEYAAVASAYSAIDVN